MHYIPKHLSAALYNALPPLPFSLLSDITVHNRVCIFILPHCQILGYPIKNARHNNAVIFTRYSSFPCFSWIQYWPVSSFYLLPAYVTRINCRRLSEFPVLFLFLLRSLLQPNLVVYFFPNSYKVSHLNHKGRETARKNCTHENPPSTWATPSTCFLQCTQFTHGTHYHCHTKSLPEWAKKYKGAAHSTTNIHESLIQLLLIYTPFRVLHLFPFFYFFLSTSSTKCVY